MTSLMCLKEIITKESIGEMSVLLWLLLIHFIFILEACCLLIVLTVILIISDMILAVGYSDGMIKVIRFNLTCGIVSDSEDVWADPDLISVNALSWQCLDIHQVRM